MAKTLFSDFFKCINSYDCTDNATMHWAENQSAESFCGFTDALEKVGYALYTRREENGNLFATYIKDNEVLNAYFTPCDGKVRMITERGVGLPPRAEDNSFSKKTAPLVTQLKTGNLKRDCGMSYIIRLSDGRFILIDTQFDEYEEADRLLETLREQNTVFEKPVFAACFFTHPHDDHISSFVRLMKEYSDEVVFGDIIYNWANPESMPYSVDTAYFDEAVKKLEGANIIKARSGQSFCYADAVFDVLFVPDDLYPERFADFNSSSLVMRMELAGRRFMWMGDTLYDSCGVITSRYSDESLKSEFLQVPHHGYYGGSVEMNKLIEPEVLLWSVPDYRYKEKWGIPQNKALLECGKVKNIFVSGRYQTVIDAEKPVPDAPLPPNFAEGEVIYQSDFTKRVIDLGWSAITCGGTDLKGAELALKNGRCIWQAEGKTILEILQAFTLEKTPSYKMEFTGRILKKPAKFGLIYNNPTPIEWQDKLFAEIEAAEGEFSINLALDAEKGVAKLRYNNKTLSECEYKPAGLHGLQVMLEQGRIEIENIKVTGGR